MFATLKEIDSKMLNIDSSLVLETASIVARVTRGLRDKFLSGGLKPQYITPEKSFKYYSKSSRKWAKLKTVFPVPFKVVNIQCCD